MSSWSLKQGWRLVAYKAQFKTPWNKPLTLHGPILIWSLLRKGKHCVRGEGFCFCLCNIKKTSVFLLPVTAMASSTTPLPAVALLPGHRRISHCPAWTVLCCQNPPLFNSAYDHLCFTFWLHSLPKVVNQKHGSFLPHWGNLPRPHFQRLLSLFNTFQSSVWMKHLFFLPWPSLVIRWQAARLHCCRALGSLSCCGQAPVHSSARQPGSACPVVLHALQASMESSLRHFATYKAHSSD